MAAGVYLEEAAKRVRDAIGALHDEIHTIQSEAYREEAQLHNDVLKIENEAAEIKMEARVTPDVGHKVVLEARVRQLENEAHHKKDEGTKIGADAARNVQAKNSLLNGLESMVSRLESMAAAAR